MKKRFLQKSLNLCLIISMLLTSTLPAYAAPAETQSPSADSKAEAKSTSDESAYLNNQGELKENPLIQLPLGSVQADSWLENQLLLMKNGLTGNMRYFNDYNEQTSAWLGAANPSSGGSWENGPYYARGLVALAYTLNDEDLINEALKWVSWSIDSQRTNGYFGPNENSWWSRMPMLCAIRDFYEAVDAKPVLERTEQEALYHGKVLQFLEQYFRYQESELPGRRLSNWADARGGDNLEVVYWLYNKLYNSGSPNATKWLLDLGDLIYSQTVNWENIYNNTTVREHVVNTSQGMKTPALYSQKSNDIKYQTALSNGLDNMGIDHGRIDGLPNSDEAARENRSTRGAETCSTVEGMLSTEIAAKISGEVWMGDRLEQLAYNALPAAYPSDYSGHAYYILQNQVMNTLGNHEFDCDHGDSSAFAAPNGFDCCFSNNHMGWSKFVQNMWMATANGGLAVVAYGPNQVTAKVAGGKTAKFQQNTDYPFKDTVNLEYYGEEAGFELKLRIPEWADSATVYVNGSMKQGVESGEYYTIDRDWKTGDQVTVTFESEVKLTTWYNNSTAVQKGALIYSLKIEEDWRTYDSNDARELKVEQKEDFPIREVYPASAWNYGLLTDENAAFTVVEEDEVALQPFNSETPPVKIIAKGQKLPEWTLDGNLAGPQPFGPLAADEDELEEITLIPYGSARLRITHFPTLGDPADSDTIVRKSGDIITRNGVTYQNFDNLVVPKAEDYKLTVQAEGNGQIIINSKYKQDVSGNFTIQNLKSLLSGNFKFDAGQYNNVRFTGDIQVREVKIETVNREISDIQVLNTVRNGTVIKITTNLDAQETPYEVQYGTESGNYTNTVRGFSTSTATLTQLESDTSYYVKVTATLCGVRQESEELVFQPSASGENKLKPNPNAPNATYEGFSTLNYMLGANDDPAQWIEYDPDNQVEIQAASHPNATKLSEIQLGNSSRMKAALNLTGSANWTDYVVESEITVADLSRNNGGIMFRVSDIGNGPDDYRGYYVGIGKVGNTSGVMVGSANYGWNEISGIHNYMDGETINIQTGQKYTLKVVVYGETFAAYLDDKLVYIYEGNELFSKGTVGVRSYETAMTIHNVTVRPVVEEDLEVFEEEEPEPSTQLIPHEEHAGASYTGFAADAAGLAGEWTKYGEESKITYEDGTDGARIKFERGTNIKAALSQTGSEYWMDYVAEAEVSFDEGVRNNAGFVFRGTQFASGPDAYHGYYVGVGQVHDDGANIHEPGLMIGYADGNWHDIKAIPMSVTAGTKYKLKVVAYDDMFAIYLDDVFVYQFTDTKFETGTVAFRSYDEGFTAYNMVVRDIVQEDLADLQPEYEEPAIIPDFSDQFDDDANWTKMGDTSLISVSNGQIHLGSSTNIKATAGDTGWSDMVYSVNVKLGTGTGNAGMLFRSSREGSGADNYYGYYFGISDTGYEIGKSSNAWKQLKLAEYDLDVSIAHELKVVAYKESFLFYIDGNYVDIVQDTDHAKGQIGLRGYRRAFDADDVAVRGLTEEEIAGVATAIEDSKKITIEGCSAYDSIQVKFPRVSNATSYRILFGTEAGVYTNEFVDIYFNSYKGGGIFTHDKAAFSTVNPGTYYVKVIGLNGNTPVAISNEVMVTTGERADTGAEQNKMRTALTAAQAIDKTNFTRTSRERYERAVSYADSLTNKSSVNQIEYATAADLLTVSANTPSSVRFSDEIDPLPDLVKALTETIEAAKALDAAKYTEESYALMTQALSQAESVNRNNIEEVSAALDALRAAMVQLVLKPGEPVDLTGLNQAIEKAKKIDSSKYTAASYEKVKAALARAEKVDRNDQAAVDAAVKELNDAIAKLQLKPVKPEVPVRGSVIKNGKLYYKVTKSAATGGTVSVLKPVSKNYKSIVIPKTVRFSGYVFKVTEIAKKAFKSNKKLKTVKIGDHVAGIGASAFASCTRLQKVSIGKGLTRIGSKAFLGDKKLKTVIIKSLKLKTVGSKAFKNIKKSAVIDVPNKKVNNYRKKFKKGGLPKTVRIK